MLWGSNMDGIKYVPSPGMKPSIGKRLSGDGVYPPQLLGVWLLGLQADLYYSYLALNQKIVALVVGHSSQEVLLR